MDLQQKWFRKGNYIIGGLFAALGLFMSAYALLNYSYMDQYSLGPAFYPSWIGLFLIVIGLLMVYQTHRGRYEELKKKIPTLQALKRLGLFVGMCVLFLLLVNFLGMVISLILFQLAVNLFIVHNQWKSSLAMALISTCVIYVVFHVLFYINFPKGFLGF